MEIIDLLSKMEEIEKKASELYGRYYSQFSQDQEAAYFFYRIQIEERGHLSLTQYVKRLATRNPELFEAVDCPEIDFRKILAFLNAELSRVRRRTLEKTLETAEKFEVTLSEGYLTLLPLRNNPMLIDLYRALIDTGHTKKITAFKIKRKKEC